MGRCANLPVSTADDAIGDGDVVASPCGRCQLDIALEAAHLHEGGRRFRPGRGVVERIVGRRRRRRPRRYTADPGDRSGRRRDARRTDRARISEVDERCLRAPLAVRRRRGRSARFTPSSLCSLSSSATFDRPVEAGPPRSGWCGPLAAHEMRHLPPRRGARDAPAARAEGRGLAMVTRRRATDQHRLLAENDQEK